MKSCKKAKAFITVLVAVILLSVVYVQAIGYPNRTVYISSSESYAESGTVYGHHKPFAGNNYSSSSRSLYADVYFSSGSGWIEESSILMSVGVSFDDARTGVYSQSYLWKLALDPQGLWTTGCNGKGHIWYR